MYMIAEVSQYVAVASFAEAWIEIHVLRVYTPHLPVASFAEAWIEMSVLEPFAVATFVASFAEAWIEIYDVKDITIKAGSPPSWRRGLK